ncbi:YokU family protein [Salipaludibacillus keqinensis]|uniref:YokU family protein n=1 Tax=Salipaludibacillus keqinensis TaxID=2045207 RepID=A0A323TIG0_9BACI|nr:YokU family protein [Salipaludibacillus keqinensis]PYZ94598.1 YokU family protein [Salipaludibacillus keqinensis]
MQCKWCNSVNAFDSLEPAYWELPDGTRAVEMKDVPSIKCPDCDMVYIEEDMIEKIETHLMLINTKNLGATFTFKEFMDQPTLLKKNYFALNENS